MEEPASFEGDTVSPFEVPYYGFQHVDMVTSHGDQCGGQYGQWFRETHPNWQALHDSANELAHDYSCPQAYRTPVPEDSYPTAWVASRAIAYLEDRVEPFFAFVSFPDPHHPFNPPGEYWEMYGPDEFTVDLPYEAHKNPVPPMEHASEMWRAGKLPPIPQMPLRADDQHIREAKALTAGMITMIDDHIGQVVQKLKETGQYDNTIIIFTSDHGDYLGDFNLMLKGPLPLPAITRVPMIWSDPATRTAVRTGALASTIDISASILDRAGLAPYDGIQGRSFLKSLDGTQPQREEVSIEHNDGGPRMGLEQAARVRTIRTQKWRFSVFAGEDWGELDDLVADPRETKNLWDDPSYSSAKAELSMRLIEHLTFQMDESPRATRLA